MTNETEKGATVRVTVRGLCYEGTGGVWHNDHQGLRSLVTDYRTIWFLDALAASQARIAELEKELGR